MIDTEGVDPGKVPPPGSDFYECAGFHALAQREIALFQSLGEDWDAYRSASSAPVPMTREGMAVYMLRALPPIVGGVGQPHPKITDDPALGASSTHNPATTETT